MDRQYKIKLLIQQQVESKNTDLINVRFKAGASIKDMLILLGGMTPPNRALPFFLARELGFEDWEELTQAALSAVDA